MRISSYSFILILLKLHRCFGHGLKICMWFGYNPQIIFYHFFCYFNLGIFLAFLLAGDINSLNLLVYFENWFACWACSIMCIFGRFSSNFVFELILGRSGLGSKMGKFCQIRTELMPFMLKIGFDALS